MLTLYYARNTCARATHIALLDAGAEFSTVRIDTSSNQQNSPEYLAVNPKGRVPALATENGVLTETPALLAYIAQRFPGAGLAPLNDPFAFARLQEFNLYLCATFHIAHGHLWRPQRWATDQATMDGLKRAAPGVIESCWSYIEEIAYRGPWAMGDTYTICDPYLFTVTSWMEFDGIDRSKFPRVAEHYRRMSDRPNVRKALEAEA
jgi:glutathione S-transferase